MRDYIRGQGRWYGPEGIDTLEMFERLAFQSAEDILKAWIGSDQMSLSVLERKREHGGYERRCISVILAQHWENRFRHYLVGLGLLCIIARCSGCLGLLSRRLRCSVGLPLARGRLLSRLRGL